MFATSCEDHVIRVFSVPSPTQARNVSVVSQPLRLFNGHSSKVFHVRWSPLREGLLASGSDDTYVFSIISLCDYISM